MFRMECAHQCTVSERMRLKRTVPEIKGHDSWRLSCRLNETDRRQGAVCSKQPLRCAADHQWHKLPLLDWTTVTVDGAK